MKTINYGGNLYVNPSHESLLQLGLSDDEARSLMVAVGAEEVLVERDARLRAAAFSIAPLQDASDLGVATEAEANQLLSWKQYRVALIRITEQEGYPGVVAWPDPPPALS